MIKKGKLYCTLIALVICMGLQAQTPVSVGGGSYASYAPLTASKTSRHGGSQAYQTEHRRIYIPDSLLARLGSPDGSRQASLALPTNDWWTYALVNQWTGKIWFYPGWAEAKDGELTIGYPTYWEATGCEMKWDTPLTVTFTNTATGKEAAFTEALVDNWSDFMMSFIMQDGDAWVRVTCMHGSPLVWLETSGITAHVTNPSAAKYLVNTQANGLTIALLTDGLTVSNVQPYLTRIPRKTTFSYAYDATTSTLSTTFSVDKEVLMGFLPHQYYSETADAERIKTADAEGIKTANVIGEYMTPRGTMKVAEGNEFTFTYPVHSFLPFFPKPMEWKEDFSATRMAELNADYAKRGTFGGDTYWGGKGLTQMAHYMTFALQMGDTATFRMAKQRLKDVLIDWYTYTPGEPRFYFARFPRFGAMVGFDTSYDSETFNDHHFHYGYFVYASAVLCMLDDDFRTQFGPMVREVARDYANWQRSADEPWFRTLDPYCGHSFAGGMGNEGNGNGQESTSEAIQGWGGVWMLGAALQDQAMLEAGIMGYTLETRATAEYWFDRKRRNIDFTKYKHPYCCNLTMQGVGWWTWFSGDPVWMHSIQWLPISPILTNHFSEDLAFTRWDYTEMYAAKEVGNYEAETNGLGDESGLGNVCLSYLSLFDADSAARVWNRMDQMGKPLAKNPDTGGITYWLAHSHKALGEKRYDIFANHPLACAYTDTLSGRTTYAVYNVGATSLSVHFFGAVDTTVTVAHGLTLICGTQTQNVTTIEDEEETIVPDPLAWNLPYPNLALHKPVTVSSFENAGSIAVNLTDGDVTTRWGSVHQDNEYAIVDLQEVCYIDHVILRWETAFASEYELAFSDDQNTWRTATYASAGGVEKVKVVQRARYIRLTGLQRATQYGTSLYELEAYGRPLTGNADKVFVVELSATDKVLYQGESTTLTTTAYNYNGVVLSTNNENLTFPDYGQFTVTRSVEDCSASYTFVVLETEHIDSIVVYPAEVKIAIGDTQVFDVCPINQFGTPIDTCEEIFEANQLGDTTLTYECHNMEVTALAHVLSYADMNLALGKPVKASGTEDEPSKGARFVNDGDMETRWGSRFQDNEWIEVDLLNCYEIDSVRLFWEAAYATSFTIFISDDADTYRQIYITSAGQGGTQTIRVINTHGRYIRLVGNKRSGGYGISLWELEVYGSGKCNSLETTTEILVSEPHNAYKFIQNGQLYIWHNGTIYTSTGHVIQ